MTGQQQADSSIGAELPSKDKVSEGIPEAGNLSVRYPNFVLRVPIQKPSIFHPEHNSHPSIETLLPDKEGDGVSTLDGDRMDTAAAIELMHECQRQRHLALGRAAHKFRESPLAVFKAESQQIMARLRQYWPAKNHRLQKTDLQFGTKNGYKPLSEGTDVPRHLCENSKHHYDLYEVPPKSEGGAQEVTIRDIRSGLEELLRLFTLQPPESEPQAQPSSWKAGTDTP